MKQPGKLVKINDTYMQVYQIPPFSARRQETIVFLSGYGTECPVYDFKPLWHRLAGAWPALAGIQTYGQKPSCCQKQSFE